VQQEHHGGDHRGERQHRHQSREWRTCTCPSRRDTRRRLGERRHRGLDDARRLCGHQRLDRHRLDRRQLDGRRIDWRRLNSQRLNGRGLNGQRIVPTPPLALLAVALAFLGGAFASWP